MKNKYKALMAGLAITLSSASANAAMNQENNVLDRVNKIRQAAVENTDETTELSQKLNTDLLSDSEGNKEKGLLARWGNMWQNYWDNWDNWSNWGNWGNWGNWLNW